MKGQTSTHGTADAGIGGGTAGDPDGPETVCGLSPRQRFAKRSTDIAVALIGGIVVLPVVAVAWTIASIDTGRNGFFVQWRIGRAGVPFKLYKIRTMRPVPGIETAVTTACDRRITRVGRLLRRWKLDELPQLWNVLRGEMSLVGPRPDVEGFADRLVGPARAVLSLRPGITGPASLKYRDEERLLAAQADPERYNAEVVFPDKTAINLRYIREYAWLKDWHYLLATVGLVEPDL